MVSTQVCTQLSYSSHTHILQLLLLVAIAGIRQFQASPYQTQYLDQVRDQRPFKASDQSPYSYRQVSVNSKSQLGKILAKLGLERLNAADIVNSVEEESASDATSEALRTLSDTKEPRRGIRRAIVRVGADHQPYLLYGPTRLVRRRKVTAPPLDLRKGLVTSSRRPRLVLLGPQGEARPPVLHHLNQRVKPVYHFKSRSSSHYFTTLLY